MSPLPRLLHLSSSSRLDASLSVPPARESSGIRSDVQALRGVAVLLVVVFHLFPSHLTGGYVGVDAFLAVSGYLITHHLWRDIARDGSFGIVSFWARRVRRLMPAAMVVLLATLCGTVLVSPKIEWERTARDVTSAIFYFYNFVLTQDATDYFAQDQSPSPVQHFWSLCVEEQFYFVWPLALLLICKLASSSERRATWIRYSAIGLFALSFLTSVTQSHLRPSASYFLLPTRMWEFLAGALVALFGLRWDLRVPPLVPRLLGFFGLFASGYILDSEATFPGWVAALPVLSTLLVLIPNSGADSQRDAPLLRPLAAIGDLSYGIYLWHWPLLVLSGHYLVRQPTAPEAAIICVGTLGLAYVTKRWVEEPFRFMRVLAVLPRRTFVAATIAMALVSSAAWTLDARYESLLQGSSALTDRVDRADPPCLGARSAATEAPCNNPALEGVIVPRPVEARNDIFEECAQENGNDKIVQCAFGPKDSEFTLALVGDSHAGHLIPGLALAAEESDIEILTFVKASCPFSRPTTGSPIQFSKDCQRWKDKVRAALKKNKTIDAIVQISHAGRWVQKAKERKLDYDTLIKDEVSAELREWDDLPRHIKQIIVIRDTPRSNRTVLPCLERLDVDEQLEPGACAVPRSFALPTDPLVVAASRRPERATVIDLSPVFCDAQTCKPVIGHVLVHGDSTHLTETFSRTLAPILADELDRRRDI